jgi:hypothetical protein
MLYGLVCATEVDDFVTANVTKSLIAQRRAARKGEKTPMVKR